MKANIHPKYNHDCLVTCTCGNKFTTGSTLPSIEVEVCSNCHPFFTGQQKFVDVKGRIDRFKDRQAKGQSYVSKSDKAKAKKAKKSEPKA